MVTQNKSRDNNKQADAHLIKMLQQSKDLEQNSRFDHLDDETKEHLLNNRKAENTNIATKQWVKCLNEFLASKKLPCVDDIQAEQLPDVIGEFYFSVRKKTHSRRGW